MSWYSTKDSAPLRLRSLGPEGPNADPHGVVPGHLASYPFDNTGVDGAADSHTLAPLPPVATPFGALVVHDAVGRLLTVREARQWASTCARYPSPLMLGRLGPVGIHRSYGEPRNTFLWCQVTKRASGNMFFLGGNCSSWPLKRQSHILALSLLETPVATMIR